MVKNYNSHYYYVHFVYVINLMYYFVHGEYFVVDIDKDNIASSVHIGCHPKIEKSCLQVFNI